MCRRPPISTLTDILCPYTPFFRSCAIDREHACRIAVFGDPREAQGEINIVARLPERRGAERKSRWEEHTSELQSLMRISYAVFCLNKKKPNQHNNIKNTIY